MSKVEEIKGMLESNPELSLSEVRKHFEAKGEKFSPPSYYHAKKQLLGGTKSKAGKKPKSKKQKSELAASTGKTDNQPRNGTSKQVPSVKAALAEFNSLTAGIRKFAATVGNNDDAKAILTEFLDTL